LTIYALFGDDLRLAATHKSMDMLFDTVTILCIVIFAVEIFAASVARPGYFGSLFFYLDLLPSLTLVLDLTFVSDALFCRNTNTIDNDSDLTSQRTSDAGIRFGKTVRIIRLIRLVKVYKMYQTFMQKYEQKHREELVAERIAQEDSSESSESEYEDDNDGGASSRYTLSTQNTMSTVDSMMFATESANALMEQQAIAKETRVGKKLGDMTTRRVITLVLVMLFGLPMFSPESYAYTDLKSSADFGVEGIYDKWRRWCHRNASHPQELPECLRLDTLVEYGTGMSFKQPLGLSTNARAWYEKHFLTFVFMHREGPFAWKLHWIGFRSRALIDALAASGSSDSISDASMRVSMLAQLGQEALLGPEELLWSGFLHPSEWNPTYADANWVQKVAELPQEVVSRLAQPWNERCIRSFAGIALAVKVKEGECSIDADLRCSEVEYHMPIGRSDAEAKDLQMVFAFDRRGITTLEAWLSMAQTVFICLAVGISSLTFTRDANNLFLKPIECMMVKLEAIKHDPMEAMHLGDLEFRHHQFQTWRKKQEYKKAGFFKKCFFKIRDAQKVAAPMETVILERTILKLCELLVLCFGEKGGEIVGNYLKGSGSSNQALTNMDLLVPGKKVKAIVGFCQMRSFDTVINCLQEDALVFINQISEFVHTIVDDYHGSPNKNMGSRFLLAWRLSEKAREKERIPKESAIEIRRKLADCAIMACIKTIARIHTDPTLAKYEQHEGLLDPTAGFHVSVGFGLHYGWAIEGIVGSDLKIDASYISPQVNLAHHIVDATEHYGVDILLSHHMMSQASPEMAIHCRVLDHVLLKKSHQPVRLYAVDLDANALANVSPNATSRGMGASTTRRKDRATMRMSISLRHEQSQINHSIKKNHSHGKKQDHRMNRFRLRQLREVAKAEKLTESYYICQEFKEDAEISAMRARYSAEFFRRFLTAYRNYECGEWLVARDMFYTCYYEPDYKTPPIGISEDQWPEDSPTRTLLKFMKQFDFVAPEDWLGYRTLPKKTHRTAQ
jgi:class 3 adenylate cyclase